MEPSKGLRLLRGGLLLAGIMPFSGPAWSQPSSYLDHRSFSRELRSLVDGSNLATMTSLGTTPGGREIWMVQVADPRGTPLDQRPGILVVGNLEGDHVVGSHLALESIRYLLSRSSEDAVAGALRNHVFYFFPRLNPDGAEAMFARVKWARRTNDRPWDDDNDGRVDEDGPEDLNGDGYITVMRVPDPAGAYLIDPSDPRLMKRADPTKGERGTHTLYWEGIDNDGDGFINEDGPGGVDLNRNFQHAYAYWQADVGPHMVSEPETRALMDFVLSHRNIAAILTFGQSDNLVTPPNARGELAAAKVLDLPAFADASNEGVFRVGLFAGAGGGGRGPGFGGGGGGGFGAGSGGGIYLRGPLPGANNDPSSGTRPATTVNTGDLPYFEHISEIYRRITGIQSVPMHRTPEGAFFQYGYFQYGVLSLSTPGWGFSAPAPGGQGRGAAVAPEAAAGGPPAQGARTGGPPSGGAAPGGRGPGGTGQAAPGGGPAPQGAVARGGGADAELLRALEELGVQAFAPWTPFQHPTLGAVEIGGFLPYATVNPPFEQVADLGAKHGQFLVELAGKLPKVRIAETKVTAHGGGIFTVSATAENVGFLPTSLRHGQTARAVGPTFLQIQVDPDDILSGADKTTSVGILNGSGGRQTVTWVIRGRPGSQVEIRLHSQKAGRDSATVTLR